MYADPLIDAALLDEADALQEQTEKEYYEDIVDPVHRCKQVSDEELLAEFINRTYDAYYSFVVTIKNKYLKSAIESSYEEMDALMSMHDIIEKGAELAVEAAVNGEDD